MFLFYYHYIICCVDLKQDRHRHTILQMDTSFIPSWVKVAVVSENIHNSLRIAKRRFRKFGRVISPGEHSLRLDDSPSASRVYMAMSCNQTQPASADRTCAAVASAIFVLIFRLLEPTLFVSRPFLIFERHSDCISCCSVIGTIYAERWLWQIITSCISKYLP